MTARIRKRVLELLVCDWGGHIIGVTAAIYLATPLAFINLINMTASVMIKRIKQLLALY